MNGNKAIRPGRWINDSFDVANTFSCNCYRYWYFFANVNQILSYRVVTIDSEVHIVLICSLYSLYLLWNSK